MPMVTDSGTEAAGESRLPSCTSSHLATGGGCCGASPVTAASARDVFDESAYEGSEAPLWADVPADILGTVLRLLALPAPLPMLVLPRLIGFSCLTSDADGAALTAPQRALMLPAVAAGDDVRILGSCDDWLMAVKNTGGEQCFLVNAFSSDVIHLPPLLRTSYYYYNCLDAYSSARYVGQSCLSGTFFKACLCSSVLSASPTSSGSVSKYTVAAYAYPGDGHDTGLALWQPGMTSWYLCLSSRIDGLSGDLAFYQGKLYMAWKYTADIFAFELREDERGNLSCPEHYKISPPIIPSKTIGSKRCNLVVWRAKLLLIIRFLIHNSYRMMDCYLRKVEVFLDFSTSPCGFTQIHNFQGDCIFVQSNGCRAFSSGFHVGVPVQGDLIYFLDERIINHASYTFVHNMGASFTS